MTIVAPPVETTTLSPLGEAVPPSRHPLGMSPLNRRRWQNFKSNRRGYWSFWIFLILFVVSLFAELIANDRPSAIRRPRSAAISRPLPIIAIPICRN
jgi:microcin C transport system permease protein